MNDRYLTVTALTKYIKRKFETDPHLKQVWLKGEISNFTQHSRGHMYLTLKDNNSKIQSVMFAGHNRKLKFRSENGMNVLVRGEIGVYEPHGQYQLYIHEMQPDGVGALYQAFEQLKKRLENEGLFSDQLKKPIPQYPQHIGIITSPTGAAIRDIISTLNRRYPIVKKSILPVSVQGDFAAKSIVDAIKKANDFGEFDVLIVGRGGGSIEELWSFNEEIVARAIASSTIPIISAVGHETDFTISDFVADLRAPTPTGAAELAVPSIIDVKEKLRSFHRRADQSITIKVNRYQEKLTQLKRSYAFRYPEQVMRQKELDLDRMIDQLNKSVKQYVSVKKEKSQSIQKRLNQQHPRKQLTQSKVQLQQAYIRNQRVMQQYFSLQQHKFQKVIEKLGLLNPLEVMKRGFAIPYKENGEVIKSVKHIQPGDPIKVQVQDGTIDCQVWGMEEEDKNVRKNTG